MQLMPKPAGLLAVVVFTESKIVVPVSFPKSTPEFSETKMPPPVLPLIVLLARSAYETFVTETPAVPLPLIVFPTMWALEARLTKMPLRVLF